MKRIVRRYVQDDMDDVLSSWESATRVGHPFLAEPFLEQERYNIPNVYLPNAETWVVEQENQVIGFISLIGNEVGAIFVKPEFHRTGAGRSLMDKALELHGDLEVEVFKAKGIGRKFYASYGFEHLLERLHEETGNELVRLKISSSEKCRGDAGADADIAIWDPARERTISKDTHHQNVDFNIFEGMTVKGINTVTLSQGKIVYRDGDVRTQRGVGRYIDRPTFAPYYDALRRTAEVNAPRAVDRM